MVSSFIGRQLALRAGTKLRGVSRAQLQRQLAVYQQVGTNLNAPRSKEMDGSSTRSDRSVIGAVQRRQSQVRPLAKGPMTSTKLRSGQGTSRLPSKSLNLSRSLGKPVNDSPDHAVIVDREKLRQNMANLAHGLYGRRVSGQVGPNGEIYFASEQKRYADVGYWYKGTQSGDGTAPTSFLLKPPFEESAVALTTSTDYEPSANPLLSAGARIINFVSSPFPTAHDSHAIVLIGGVVSIPRGYSKIHVTTTATIRSSIMVKTAGPDLTSASHYFQAKLEGPGFSPDPLGKFLEWMIGTTPPDLHPVPRDESISLSWNLGGRHGEFLVLVGLMGLYHCMGVGSSISASCSIDVRSIRVDVS